MSPTAAGNGDQQPTADPGARPAAPTTAAELERSISLIRTAIAVGVVLIAAMTFAFCAFLGAPLVPLVPIAALVVVVDLIMLVAFTRQRRQALEKLRGAGGGLPAA